MNFYEDTRGLFTRMGRTDERPTTPPDKSALFWDIQTGRLYGVNDSMEWVLINQPFPAKTSMETFTGNFTFATTPSGLLMVSGTNTLITEVVVDVQTPFTDGITAKIGDNADTDRLFPAANMNLQEVGTYYYHPFFTYPVPTNIEVRVDGGGVTGFAAVYIVYDLDSQN